MNMNRVTLGKWLMAVVIIATFHCRPALGLEEYSGAFYFGNSAPGNGIIGPTDVTNVKLQAGAGTGNYLDCKPDNALIQDVDGNGAVGPTDVTKIKLWVAKNMDTGAEGKAFSIEVLTPTFTLPSLGETCANGTELCVKVWDNPGLSNGLADLRSGWGVNFKVDPASECPTARLCGRDPTPTLGCGKDCMIAGPMVFQYSGMDGPGQACVRVIDPGGCGGKTVTIDTYIPDDTEALYQTGTIGRFTGLPAVTGTPMIGISPCGILNLTVTPDPGAVNDGNTLQMVVTDACDGDVTFNVNTTWSVTSGTCTVNSTGLVTAPEGCSAASCTIQAVYTSGYSRQDSATVNVYDNEAGTFNSLSAAACGSMNDPANPVGGVNCTTPNRISSDGCNRGPASCTWSFSGNVGLELCADGSYTGRCTDGAFFSEDAAVVTDNEAGTFNSLSTTTCSPVNDGGAISCSTPDRISSADGCNRGAAVCAWACTAGCSAGLTTTELCLPTLTAPYTGRCTDGAYNVSDGSTVNNNETAITALTVTPPGPVGLSLSGAQDFYASGTFADGCTINADASANWTKTGNCVGGTLGATGLYTAPGSGGACADVVTATQSGVSDSTTVVVTPAGTGYFPIATTLKPEGAVSAAFDGTNFLVGINGSVDSMFTINAQLVSPEGTLVGDLIPLASDGAMPLIAFDGTNYLALIEDHSAEPTISISARFISPAGVAGSTIIIRTYNHIDMYGLTYGGGKYLLTTVRQDPGWNEGSGKLYGRTITTAGVVSGATLITGDTVWTGGSDSGMHSAFDGTNFMVTWVPKSQATNFDDKTVEGRFVNTSGVPQGSDFVIDGDTTHLNDNPYAVAFGGGKYLVVWDDEVGGHGSGDWDLKGQLVTPAGALSGGVINITSGTGHQMLPFIVFDGVNFLVSYTDLSRDVDRDWMCDPWLEEGSCLNIYGRFITPAGTLLGNHFPIHAANGNDVGGAVAFGDGKYLVLNNQGLSWDPFRDNLTGEDVYGLFLPPAPASEANPPSPPSNLTAAKGDGAVDLSWTASTDDTGVAGYDVHFCSGETIDTVTTTTYSHPSRFINKSLCYYVQAFDWSGNYSIASNQVNETPQLALKIESDGRNDAIMGTLGASTVEAGQPIMIFLSNALPSPGTVAVEFRNLPSGAWLPATNVNLVYFFIACNVPGGLAAGNAEVRVTMDARVSNSYPVTVVSGAWTPGAYVVSGQATDGVDPVDGAYVLALAQDLAREGGIYTAGALTNGSGNYTLNLDPGLYELITLKEGGNLQQSDVRLAVSGSTTQDLVLPPGLVYSGWVVNSLDSSIKPGCGYIQLKDSDDNNMGESRVYADGSFRIVTSAGARYQELELQNELLYPASVSPISGGTIFADRTDQFASMTRGAPFEIWAGDTADPPAPIPGIRMYINYSGSFQENRGATDNNGFALIPTFGGTVELDARVDNYDTVPYVSGRIQGFTMPTNGMNFGVLTMYRGYKVTGQVVAGDTTGPFYAKFRIGNNNPPPESPFTSLFSDRVTNDLGDFVGRAYSGSNDIYLDFEDYNHDHGTTYIPISETRIFSADTDLGTYTAYQGVGITGNIVDNQGQPVSGVDVQCQNSSPSFTGNYWLDYPDSYFEVLVYPDSNITCWVWDNWGGGHQTYFPGNPINCPGPVPMECNQGTITLNYRPSGEYLTLSPKPASVNDGNTIRFTATDSANGNVTQNANTNWSVTSGPCTVSNTSPNKGRVTAPEACSNYSCTIQAVYNPGVSRQDSAGLGVTDNEAGTFSSLSPLTCSPVNDGSAISCSTPNRFSSDGCNRGAATCTWSCTAGCSSGLNTAELCMPTLTGPYTGRCTDGSANVSDASTVTNNETTLTHMTVTPLGPISLPLSGTQDFYAKMSYADGCTISADASANWTKTGGCVGSSLGATGLYTAPSTGGTCTDVVTATQAGLSDSSTVITSQGTGTAAALTRAAVDSLMNQSDNFTAISNQLASALAADPTYYPAIYFKALVDYLKKVKSSALDPGQVTCSLRNDIYIPMGMFDAGDGTFYNIDLQRVRQTFSSIPGGCTERTYQGHHYLFCTTAKTWTQAQAACRAVNGDLVTINDDDENMWVASNLSRSWIGFNLMGKDCCGGQGSRDWEWSDPNACRDEDCGYWGLYFQDGSWTCDVPPYNCGGYSQPCADMYDYGIWQDDSCSLGLPYVCEEVQDLSQGEFRDTFPTGDDLAGFVTTCTIPELETLLTEIGEPPPDFEYSVNYDLDNDSFNETIWIDAGDVNMVKAELNMVLAGLKIATAYDWNNVDFNDFDGNGGLIHIDGLGIVSASYPALGNLKTGGAASLAAAKTNVIDGETLFQAGMNFIVAEGPTDCASGFLNLCRHNSEWGLPSTPESGIQFSKLIEGFQDQADIDKFKADAGRFQTEADGMVGSFGTDAYHTFMMPPGSTVDPHKYSNFNFYKFWAGVNFRSTFFKTIIDPMQSPTETRFGVTDLSQLDSANMLTVLGLTTMANGTTIVAGDLQNGMPVYNLRLDAPINHTKTIDGIFTDWDTAGQTNCTLIYQPSMASVPYPRLPAPQVFAAVDSTNLYLLFTKNIGYSAENGEIMVHSNNGDFNIRWDEYGTCNEAMYPVNLAGTTASGGEVEMAVPLANFIHDGWIETKFNFSNDDESTGHGYETDHDFINVPVVTQPNCGTGVCQPAEFEDTLSCPADCYCGDAVCDAYEHANCNCSLDCGFSCGGFGSCGGGGPVCGNATCEWWNGENGSWCSDCYGYCGDSYCDIVHGEKSDWCSHDCYCTCGDLICDSPCENNSTCPADCSSSAYCGDSNCDVGNGENGSWCSDCYDYCGDDYCDVWHNEYSGNCGWDCYCGDGVCDYYEYMYHTCPGMDGCPSGAYCGNDMCEWWDGEDGSWCSDCYGYCGDDYCDIWNDEHSGNCGNDCWCGDAVCDYYEYMYDTCSGMDGCP
jgi:hypothetical protein